MMKKMLFSAMVCVAAFAVSQTATAREFADIYVDCGLGAMIAPNTPAVAAVTNVTWDLGTTAVISNASSPNTCKGGKAKTAAFIHDSYVPIERDLSRGQGEYMDTLMVTAGCSEESRAAISAAVRKDFTSSVAAPGYTDQTRFEKSEALYNSLQNQMNGEFAGSCTGNS